MAAISDRKFNFVLWKRNELEIRKGIYTGFLTLFALPGKSVKGYGNRDAGLHYNA